MRIKGVGFFLREMGNGLYQLHRWASVNFKEPLAVISHKGVEWIDPKAAEVYEIEVKSGVVYVRRKPRRGAFATSTADFSSF